MKTVALYLLSVAFAGLLNAQNAVQVQKAELSIPFGTVPGKLVSVGDYLVFVDDEKPENSFAVSRTDVRNVTSEKDTITLATSKPVRDRSGERSQFVFRVADPSALASLAIWSKSQNPMPPAPTSPGPAPSTPAASGSPAPAPAGPGIYEARHKHFPRGSCNGRLIITDKQVNYESVSKLDDSRRWELKDIKEVKRDSPYEIKIVPFVGHEYNLEIPGSGMDAAEYKTLLDRIAQARAAQ